MDPGSILQIVVLILLIALSAFFSSAETALTTVSYIRILSLIEEENKRALNLKKVLDNKPKMLSAILIGNNIVNLSASALTTSLTIRLWGNSVIGIATGVLTLLVLIFGEITPKTLATLHAEQISLSYAGIVLLVMKILTPVIFVVNGLAMQVLKLFRVDPDKRQALVTESELRTMVDVGHEEGSIESDEREMINNVFDFGDSEAQDIMIPRIDMTFVHIDATYKEVIDIFKSDRFTRLPVYEDTTDTIVGILNIKDLLLAEATDTFQIKNVMRDAYFTYEHKNTAALLDEMREQSINFAIVLDEYGVTAGLITLEDLLEEIVGEINDEYTERDEDEIIEVVPESEYIVLGSTKIEDLNDVLGLSLESEDYDSIGGYIIEHSEDKLPLIGEFILTDDNVRFVVDEVDKNRITKVHIFLPEKPKEEETIQ